MVNAINSIDIIGEYDMDALRYTLFTGSTSGKDNSLSKYKVEAKRKSPINFCNAFQIIVGNLKGILMKIGAILRRLL